MNKLISLLLTVVLLAPDFAFAQAAPAPEKLAKEIRNTVTFAEQSAETLFRNPFSSHILNSRAYGQFEQGEKAIYQAVASNSHNDLFIYNVKKSLPQKAQRDYLEKVVQAARAKTGPVKAMGIISSDAAFTERMAKTLIRKGRLNFSRLTFEVQKRLGISYDRAIALALNTEIRMARAAVENAITLEIQNAKLYTRHSMMRIFNGTLPVGMKKEAAKNIAAHYERMKNLYALRGANNKTLIKRVFGKAELRSIKTVIERAPATEAAFRGLRNKLFVQKLARKAAYSIPAAASILLFVSVLPQDSYSNPKYYEEVVSNTVKNKAERMKQYNEIINTYPELILILSSSDSIAAKEIEELLLTQDGRHAPLTEILPFMAWSAEYLTIPFRSEEAADEYIKNVEYLNNEVLKELDEENQTDFWQQIKGLKYQENNYKPEQFNFLMEK